MKNCILGTYNPNECVFLIKNMKNIIEPVTIEKKKQLILSGKKTYEMIPYEYRVDKNTEKLFISLVNRTSPEIAKYVGILSEGIIQRKGKKIVLVSLARGGIAVGVLCRRYLKKYYNISVPHYVISLIRNEGIDINALNTIINEHRGYCIQFIDGWTGMGYISEQLKKYIIDYNQKYNQKIDYSLGVLVDSSKICTFYGTRKDTIFPASCLNATVCGMISSIYYDKDQMDINDYHGAVQWDDSIGIDYSLFLVDSIEKYFTKQHSIFEPTDPHYSITCLNRIKNKYNISQNKNIKLGIGESMRAIIRNNIDYLLVKEPNSSYIDFLIDLAKEKNIKIHQYSEMDYECAAIINIKEGM